MKSKFSLVIAALLITNSLFAQKPSPKLLDPNNHTLVLIDHQPQMAFAAQSHPIEIIRNNVAMIGNNGETDPPKTVQSDPPVTVHTDPPVTAQSDPPKEVRI